jgi:Tfp pilus assembly protein PilX
MKPIKKIVCQKRAGAALILSMTFVLIFSALAISMATMSGRNVQIANNQRAETKAIEEWLRMVDKPLETKMTRS